MSAISLQAPEGLPFITVSKVLNARREQVFKAYVDPQLIPQWWGGGDNSTTSVEEMEVRRGGKWRFVERDENGDLFIFHGVYHQVLPPSRLVYTFEWEGMPGHVLLSVIEFHEQDGRTVITENSVFQSLEDRDGMLQSGMEAGAEKTLTRFAALL